uniref:Methyltransferase n=1 Tax=Desulfobacca acetoxidans TaxID=60893 RepID=A0A7V4G7E3_9BACT
MNPWAKIILGDSRAMTAVADAAVDLVVTSPPYWHLKDYSVPGQIGYGQSLHEYLRDLYRVWRECFRVLRPGGRLCINIGDQFARASVYGRYKVIPLQAEIIAQGERLGFDFLGNIIWQKKTTMNTTGGAPLMGSYPYPPNGLVEIDYEYIVILKKPGPGKKVPTEVKAASRLTKEEWKAYFTGHWHFGGARQVGHEARFPEELPRRLIRMFTFVGDTVLDPFLGSGTTVKAALELARNAYGYEINENFLEIMKEQAVLQGRLPLFQNIEIVKPARAVADPAHLDYLPRITDASSQPEAPARKTAPPRLHKVVKIIDERTLMLEDGRHISFLGVDIRNKEAILGYLQKFILGKSVMIRYPDNQCHPINNSAAYIYLKNKLFINSYLLKAGYATPDKNIEHKYKNKFMKIYEEYSGGIAGESVPK